MSAVTKTFFLLLTTLIFTKITLGIIGGKPTTNVAFPSVCLVKYHSNQYCGAALIMPNWVMTAAHCIDPAIVKNSIQGVGVGFYNLGNFEGKIAATIEETINPNYTVSATITIHDLGLMRMYDNVRQAKTIHPLPIAEEQEYGLNSECKTAGWGMININIHMKNLSEGTTFFHKENVLYEVDQLIVDIADCSRYIGRFKSNISLSSDNHICARSKTEASGPSFGDFGGPLICNGKQAGISSFALYDPAVDKYLYAVYTPIIKHKAWIEQVLQMNKGLSTNSNVAHGQKWEGIPPNASKEEMVKMLPDLVKSKVLEIKCNMALVIFIGIILMYSIFNL